MTFVGVPLLELVVLMLLTISTQGIFVYKTAFQIKQVYLISGRCESIVLVCSETSV